MLDELSILVIFLKILIVSIITTLIYKLTSKIHMKKKIASTLWKKVPNSIYLLTKYIGIISFSLVIKENMQINENIQSNKYKAEITIDVTATFLKLDVFFKYGGIK